MCSLEVKTLNHFIIINNENALIKLWFWIISEHFQGLPVGALPAFLHNLQNTTGYNIAKPIARPAAYHPHHPPHPSHHPPQHHLPPNAHHTLHQILACRTPYLTGERFSIISCNILSARFLIFQTTSINAKSTISVIEISILQYREDTLKFSSAMSIWLFCISNIARKVYCAPIAVCSCICGWSKHIIRNMRVRKGAKTASCLDLSRYKRVSSYIIRRERERERRERVIAHTTRTSCIRKAKHKQIHVHRSCITLLAKQPPERERSNKCAQISLLRCWWCIHWRYTHTIQYTGSVVRWHWCCCFLSRSMIVARRVFNQFTHRWSHAPSPKTQLTAYRRIDNVMYTYTQKLSQCRIYSPSSDQNSAENFHSTFMRFCWKSLGC